MMNKTDKINPTKIMQNYMDQFKQIYKSENPNYEVLDPLVKTLASKNASIFNQGIQLLALNLSMEYENHTKGVQENDLGLYVKMITHFSERMNNYLS
jgi:hypothetical protein